MENSLDKHFILQVKFRVFESMSFEEFCVLIIKTNQKSNVFIDCWQSVFSLKFSGAMRRDVLAKGEWGKTWGMGRVMARAFFPQSAIPHLFPLLLYIANAILPFCIPDD